MDTETQRSMEKCVLGTCMIDDKMAEHILTNYNETYFYTNIARRLFHRLQEINITDKAIIVSRLENDAELKNYAIDCFDEVITVDNSQYYLQELAKERARRGIKSIGLEIQVSDLDDIPAVLEKLTNKINDLRPAEKIDKKKELDAVVDMFFELKNRGFEMDFGIPKLDKLAVLRRMGFYVLGGKPGSGKSAFAFWLADKIAFQNKKKALVFSLEMPLIAAVGRLTSIISNGLLPAYKIQRPWYLQKEDFIHITNCCGKLYKQNLEVVAGDWKLSAMISKIKEAKPDIVFIDHLQCIELSGGKYDKRHDILDDCVASLISLAKKENIVIFALSHIPTNERDGVFAGTSGIIKRADLGMKIIRQEEKKITISKPENYCEIEIVKNRLTGSAGKIGLLFDKDSLRFRECAEYEGKEL